MRRHLVVLAIGLAACSDAATSASNPFEQIAGTYSEYTVDGQQLPVTTPADTCERVNTGGWLSVTTEGTYSMVLDRTRRVCNGVLSGGDYIAQLGTYEMTSDTVITFVPTPPWGPPFVATFDPGNYTPEQGGRVRNLRFSFVGHDYSVLDEVPPATERR